MLSANIEATTQTIKVEEWEELSLPAGAQCPQQSWPTTSYMPETRADADRQHTWFIAGGNEYGLGSTVFRLDWKDGRPEEWFQLPPGDFVSDVLWTETQGWQALTVGGNPDCFNKQNHEGISRACASQSGVLYLVDDAGNYSQLLASNSIGRCAGAFSPAGTAIAFKESNLCVTYLEQDVSCQIVVVDLNGGHRWTVPMAPGDSQYGHWWSPDGRWIVFMVRDVLVRDIQIRIVDAQTQHVRTLWSSLTSDLDDSCGMVALLTFGLLTGAECSGTVLPGQTLSERKAWRFLT